MQELDLDGNDGLPGNDPVSDLLWSSAQFNNEIRVSKGVIITSSQPIYVSYRVVRKDFPNNDSAAGYYTSKGTAAMGANNGNRFKTGHMVQRTSYTDNAGNTNTRMNILTNAFVGAMSVDDDNLIRIRDIPNNLFLNGALFDFNTYTDRPRPVTAAPPGIDVNFDRGDAIAYGARSNNFFTNTPQNNEAFIGADIRTTLANDKLVVVCGNGTGVVPSNDVDAVSYTHLTLPTTPYV